jgi:hypothetical protein
MRLLAGLIGSSPSWESLLGQEGFPWRLLPRDGEWFDLCSVLIVTHRLEGRERDLATRFLHRGGALLGCGLHLNGLGNMTTRKVHLRYLLPDQDSLFPHVRLLDLAMEGEIPREATHLRTNAREYALFAGEFGGGVGVVLPFDMQSALSDSRVAAKAFYSTRERLPSERVSLVGKGEIRHVVRSALSWLHTARGLPYAHLWYYPGNHRSVGSLRVDTDGAPREDIDALYAIMHDAGVRGTWFLDVRAHETWLPHFHALEGQEIGLHCYEHRFGNNLHADEENLRRGAEMLRAGGWQDPGFAAPYGTWSPAYGALTDRMGFAYCSEFGCAYDTLPFVPLVRNGSLRTLQVPIHPISIGSLLRTAARTPEMQHYYEETTADLLARQMPLFYYHHPTHRRWDVVRTMVRRFREPGILAMTMGEYATWWARRSALNVGLEVSGSHLLVRNGDLAQAADVQLHVVRVDGQEAIVPAPGPIELQQLRCDMPHASAAPQDLFRIRETDPRRMLGELYAAMLRRLK